MDTYEHAKIYALNYFFAEHDDLVTWNNLFYSGDEFESIVSDRFKFMSISDIKDCLLDMVETLLEYKTNG